MYINIGLPWNFTNAIDFDGTIVNIEVYWPTQEQFRVLDGLLDSVTGVNRCDSLVYDTVIEQGKRVLEGICSVEEAVEEISKKVLIYLAE